MCATWWKRIPERSVYERPSSVTIGKVCHRKVNVYTSLSAEENVFFVRSCRRRGIERSLSHSLSSLFSSNVSTHRTYSFQHTVLRTFVPFFYFCKQREREKGIFPLILYLGDRFPLRLVCFPRRSFILFAVLSGPN